MVQLNDPLFPLLLSVKTKGNQMSKFYVAARFRCVVVEAESFRDAMLRGLDALEAIVEGTISNVICRPATEDEIDLHFAPAVPTAEEIIAEESGLTADEIKLAPLEIEAIKICEGMLRNGGTISMTKPGSVRLANLLVEIAELVGDDADDLLAHYEVEARMNVGLSTPAEC
jgi:hypothetical protein